MSDNAEKEAPLLRGQGLRERSEIVGRLRRFARGGENRAVVVAQQFEPIFDVSGVPELALDAKMRTEECGAITHPLATSCDL